MLQKHVFKGLWHCHRKRRIGRQGPSQSLYSWCETEWRILERHVLWHTTHSNRRLSETRLEAFQAAYQDRLHSQNVILRTLCNRNRNNLLKLSVIPSKHALATLRGWPLIIWRESPQMSFIRSLWLRTPASVTLVYNSLTHQSYTTKYPYR